MRIFDDIYRKMVFWVGDVRKLDVFPWVTWDVHQHKVRHEEVLEALPLIQYGDVGLHRDAGFLSNVAIPGFMKHAWIHTQDGNTSPAIIEAISEGVVKRSPVYPMFSDYTIILRPRDVTEAERKGACLKAQSIVGERYDHQFEFDIEEELKHYGDDSLANLSVRTRDAITHLEEGQEWLCKHDHGFSCTEVVGYAWWHRRDHLGIFREQHRGKSVIVADKFLNYGWDVIWASESVTVDVAAKMGLHEEGVELIRAYRS